jgi:diguanylate cyclase (GGDEF)-like protein
VKLRLKILLLLIPLIIAPLFVLGWIAYGELRGIAEEKSFDTMIEAIDKIRARSEVQLKTAEANIELFAKHTMVRKYILTQDESERYTLMQGPLLRAFRSFQEAFPEYYEIRILLPDGYEDIRLTNPPVPNLTDEELDNPVFQNLIRAGDAVSSAIFRNPDNGEVSLFVGKPLILRDPSVDSIGTPPSLRGYLAITVDMGDIESIITNTTIGQTGYLLATDDNGKLLYQPQGMGIDAGMAAKLNDKVIAVSGSTRPVVADFNQQRSFIEGQQLFRDFRVFAILPERDLLPASLKLALAVAAITLAAIVLTTTALFLTLQHFIVRPVRALRSMSRDIGCGRLDIHNTLDSKDEIGELAAAFEEMAANLRRSDEQIRYIAYHDNLTGLPNRAMFSQYLRHVIADARRHDKQFALLFLDVDDFKRVNDTLGHQAGDTLLKEVAERLSNCLRQGDYVARLDSVGGPDELLARLGGDEFVILLPGINGPHAPSTLANRLLNVLSEPVRLAEHEFYISASIGITLFPSDGEDAETLTKNADIAMYHAKKQGKNDYQFYLQSMNILAHERLSLENELRRALDNGELCLFYQPQIDTASHAIIGWEALLRWQHPEDGMIPPGVFIPVAEETGLMLDIGEWVINEACRQGRVWQAAGLPATRIAVNISGHQFGRQNLPHLINAALRRNNLAADCLEIEITESAIMENPDRAVKELSAIKDLGVGIALDDFGTGYSSFSYLHRFPIDTLKIDRSFIQNIGVTENSSELVAAIIAMAHILKLRVVAEGIEIEEQLEELAGRNCDVIQGFLFKPPVPAAEVPALLLGGRVKTA